MDMDMGSMSMDMSSPNMYLYMQKMYWVVVGSAIAAFTLANGYSKFLGWQRLRSKSSTPAKPRLLPALSLATSTAILREASHASFGSIVVRGRRYATPTVGKTLVALLYLMVILVLCFYGFDVMDVFSFENIGYRTGDVAVVQLPLLFLLAGKRNIIAGLIGSSYERINWLHRWAARCMFITATIHMGYWFADWNPFAYIPEKVQTDRITQYGIAAWAVLGWIVFSSFAPIRGWRYEFFVVQHIISFSAFVGLVYMHRPVNNATVVWITVAIFFLDRLLRLGSYLYNNLFKFHTTSNSMGQYRDLWGSRATFQSLPGGCTRITLDNPPAKWRPGQHVFLSCQALVPLQAHPFTISSIPSDGKMEFIVQCRNGGTRRLLRHAERCLPETQLDLSFRKHVAIEGPYGRVRPLEQFDSVVMYAGSTGATFTMPLMRDIVQRWKTNSPVVTRRIKFVWVIKSGAQLEWFREQLHEVIADSAVARDQGQDVQVSISLYVTCDDGFTSQHCAPTTQASCGQGVVEEVQYTEKKSDTVVTSIETVPSSPSRIVPHTNCCCRSDVDENDTDAPACTCSCCGIEEVNTSDSSSSITDIKKKPHSSTTALHPDIHVYSGRPMIADIMRTGIEYARGESAVLACGPRGLISDVRAASVALSDERAVHKGTGAQGIWLHTEAFSY